MTSGVWSVECGVRICGNEEGGMKNEACDSYLLQVPPELGGEGVPDGAPQVADVHPRGVGLARGTHARKERNFPATTKIVIASVRNCVRLCVRRV